MKKVTLLRNPVSLADLQFDEMDDTGDWQLKEEHIVKRQEKRLRLSGM